MGVHQSIDAASLYAQSDVAFSGLLVTSKENEMHRQLISQTSSLPFQVRQPQCATYRKVETKVGIPLDIPIFYIFRGVSCNRLRGLQIGFLNAFNVEPMASAPFSSSSSPLLEVSSPSSMQQCWAHHLLLTSSLLDCLARPYSPSRSQALPLA